MKQRKCPKCEKALETHRMVGVEFEVCPACSGVWLDRGELRSLTRSRGGASLDIEVSRNRKTEYKCPRCVPPVLLFEGDHNLPHEFLLDVCPDCHGVWFDRGEFPSLLKKH